jgi:peptidoglycan/xylan/chitin deacetylase (PgdA/CDA1 family)
MISNILRWLRNSLQSKPTQKTICVCHDIERGWGHIDVDPVFASHADSISSNALEEMLQIEKQMNVKATYNVLGCFLKEVRERIERDGHCLGFHSYDHNTNINQLEQCRLIDQRIKGYRPPQSKITAELCDARLNIYNFQWLASSVSSLQIMHPHVENRIVKIPVLFDDYDLHTGKRNYREWEERALRAIEKNDFVAFGLHDCYSDQWLPYYGAFLERISALGVFRTLDEVANAL